MEGIINPLAVQERMRCGNCQHEWLAYEIGSDIAPACPSCGSADIRMA